MANTTSAAVTIDQIGKFDMILGHQHEINGWVPLLGGKVYRFIGDGQYQLQKFSDEEKSDKCPRVIMTIIHVIKNIFSFILFPWLIGVYKKRDAERALLKARVSNKPTHTERREPTSSSSTGRDNEGGIPQLAPRNRGVTVEEEQEKSVRDFRAQHGAGHLNMGPANPLTASATVTRAPTSTTSQLLVPHRLGSRHAVAPPSSVTVIHRVVPAVSSAAAQSVRPEDSLLVQDLDPQTCVQHELHMDQHYVYIPPVSTPVKQGRGVFDVGHPVKCRGGAIEVMEMMRAASRQDTGAIYSMGIAGNAVRATGAHMSSIQGSKYSVMGIDSTLHGQEESIYNVAYTAQATIILTMDSAHQAAAIKKLLAAALRNNPDCVRYPFYTHFNQAKYFKCDSGQNISRLIQLLFAASIQGISTEVSSSGSCKRMRFGFPNAQIESDFAHPTAQHYTQCISHGAILPSLDHDVDNTSRLTAARHLNGKAPNAFPVRILNNHGPNTVNDRGFVSMVKTFDANAEADINDFKDKIKYAVIGQLVKAMTEGSQYVVLPLISTFLYCKQDWRREVSREFPQIVNAALKTPVKFADGSTGRLGQYFNDVKIAGLEFDSDHDNWRKKRALKQKYESEDWMKFAKDTWMKEMKATIAAH